MLTHVRAGALLTSGQYLQLLLENSRGIVGTEHLGCQPIHRVLQVLVQAGGLVMWEEMDPINMVSMETSSPQAMPDFLEEPGKITLAAESEQKLPRPGWGQG